MLHAVSVPGSYISFRKSPVVKRPLLCTKHQISASLHNSDGDKVEYTPWLIVGLGNPGNKYYGTRHNVGFEMIDQISQAEGISLNTIQSKALIGIGIPESLSAYDPCDVVLNFVGQVRCSATSIEPLKFHRPGAYITGKTSGLYEFQWRSSGTTCFLLSGAFTSYSVGKILGVPLVQTVIYDEMSLPNGVIRLQPKGGHGHHNGMKSVMDHLDSSRNFPRMCIGIGNPPGTMDMKAFLLQKFSSEERVQIDGALEQGVDAVRTLVLKGFDENINRFNIKQKYKFHKV